MKHLFPYPIGTLRDLGKAREWYGDIAATAGVLLLVLAAVILI